MCACLCLNIYISNFIKKYDKLLVTIKCTFNQISLSINNRINNAYQNLIKLIL